MDFGSTIVALVVEGGVTVQIHVPVGATSAFGHMHRFDVG